MRWLLFLSRVAFICNIFFLLVVSIQFAKWIIDEELVSTIVILGYLMVAILNPFVNLCYLILLMGKRSKLRLIPSWLVMANFLFLIIEGAYIVYLNTVK